MQVLSRKGSIRSKYFAQQAMVLKRFTKFLELNDWPIVSKKLENSNQFRIRYSNTKHISIIHEPYKVAFDKLNPDSRSTPNFIRSSIYSKVSQTTMPTYILRSADFPTFLRVIKAQKQKFENQNTRRQTFTLEIHQGS